MKKILFLTLCCFFHSYSYASREDILEKINLVSSYNGTIIGYAVYCSYPKEEIDVVKTQFVNNINSIGLEKNDYSYIQKTFMDSYKIAQSTGPTQSKMSCSQFEIEFKKIYKGIKDAQNSQ